MQLDLILEADLAPSQITELAVLAESYGFRAIWAQNYARARDAFMSIVPAALATQRIGIGVVVVSGYEMHPLKMANILLTLNEYCHGRAQLVIGGGGEWPGVLGVEYGKRITGFGEAIDIVKAALTRKVVNYDGQVYRSRGYIAHWARDTPPLVYGGATGPKMLHAAAKAADGVMMSDLSLEMLDTYVGHLRRSLAERGRDPATFRVNNFVAWHVKKDKEESFAEARRELMIRGWMERDWLAPYLEPQDLEFVMANKWPFLKAFRERHGNIEGVPPHITAALVEGLSCAGDLSDLERHTERLREYGRRGVGEIALRLHDKPADAIRMLGEHVLPALR